MKTEDPMFNAYVVVEALMEGLRPTDDVLNEKCNRALFSIGELAIQWLVEVANNNRTSAPHRERLLSIVSQIQQSGRAGTNIDGSILEALLDALRVSAVSLNRKATMAFCRLRPASVNCLILEAFEKFKQPGYCVRLLKAAEQVGSQPESLRLLNLHVLAIGKNRRIREQAVKLLLRFEPYWSQGGFPPRWAPSAAERQPVSSGGPSERGTATNAAVPL